MVHIAVNWNLEYMMRLMPVDDKILWMYDESNHSIFSFKLCTYPLYPVDWDQKSRDYICMESQSKNGSKINSAKQCKQTYLTAKTCTLLT